jgi:glycosyltransferase involved in cell wall biosynthesis
MVDSTRLRISVVTITYKHETFIAEAINGVLMQQCDFDVELIIVDDCSPDNTKVVVDSFANHPNFKWIKYIRHDSNKGMMSNFIWALKQASGKYIALCEGDDYWTNPLKLQKQVDFLEENESCVMCFHDVRILQSNGIIEEDFITNVPKGIKLDQKALVVNSNFIHTPSVMFRNRFLLDIPRSFQFSPVGDYLLYLWLTNFGDIGYLRESMGVYRYGVGVHSTKSEEKRKNEWFWVVLMGTFLVGKTENLDYLENKLATFLKQAVRWDNLIYDYSFKEGVEKFVLCCSNIHMKERQSNIKNMSTKMIFHMLRKRVLNEFTKR